MEGEGDHAQHGGGGSSPRQRPAVYAARKLRKEMSLAEVLLWQELRKRPGGLKFRRQHAIAPYIVDFYCSSAALIIEVDGAAHNGAGAERDAKRDEILRSRGLTLIRIPASEVLADPGGVSISIVNEAKNPLHHPSGGPPPHKWGGF
ncbi:endonuclease domain-containing protein [Allosphingosinicella deserti]|uniref:endonuclease domain-containing protein n=1 Tax=Allosphingosinicella deserti TaxID=2116704 RepID=UPI0022B93C69|nr:DUF559 domain-containing protein [Sphingomonas deserti]